MSSYLEDVKRHGLPAIDSSRLHLAKVPSVCLLQFLNVTVFVFEFQRVDFTLKKVEGRPTNNGDSSSALALKNPPLQGKRQRPFRHRTTADPTTRQCEA